MSNKIIPTIELENGERYEIKRTRYILVEIDKMRENTALTDEENKNYALLQDKYARLEKLATRVKELEDDYYKDFDEEKGAIYDKAKERYNALFEETAQFEVTTNGISEKVRRETINKVERLIIQSLTMDYQGETIRTYAEAEEIWCTYVDEIGQVSAQEWLLFAFNYLSGNDEDNEDNPFVTAAKQKAAKKLNMRKGIEKVR